MYTITFKRTDTNTTKKVASFETMKDANKAIKKMLKDGRIEKRGYDLFSKKFRNLELVMNF